MKKILSLTLLFVGLLLVSCSQNKIKTNAKISIETLTPARSSVYVSLNVIDEDEEITPNTIMGRVLENGEEITSKLAEIRKDEETEEILAYIIEIAGLKVGAEYTFEVYATINKTLHVFEKQPFKTSTVGANENDPKLIKTVEDFFLMETDSAAYFKLANDIDFQGETIPTLFQTRFNGHLDGNNFSLKNISIDNRRTYTALFGRVTGSIKNLTIDNMSITLVGVNKHSQYISFLSGRNSGTITNVKVINSKIETQFNYTGKLYIGGIAAYSDTSATILNSSVDATFTLTATSQTEFHVGGLVGYMNQSKLLESSAHVTMAINNAYKGVFGGAVGLATTTTTVQSEISDTVANLTLDIATVVKSIRTNTDTKLPETIEVIIGGFVGKTSLTKITSSIAESKINIHDAKITAQNSRAYDLYAVGGFVGLLYNDSSLLNTYYKTDITSDIDLESPTDLFDFVYIGGNVGAATSAKIEKASGDFLVNIQKMGTTLQVSPAHGQLLEGDYFSSKITYDSVEYSDQALKIDEALTPTGLTPTSKTDYFTSDFVKGYLDKP